MHQSPSILCNIDDQIATLTLNVPERHNALANDDLSLLDDYLKAIAENDNVRVVVLTGAGQKTFCAGASLGDVHQGLLDGNLFQQTVGRLEGFPKPTICSLNGSVYGGGVELALACDFRIGLIGSKLFVPPAKLGLCYPYVGLQRFVSRLGLQTAKRLLLANETFTAEEAKQTGLFDYLAEAGERANITLALAQKLSQLAPLSLQSMKLTLNEIARGQGNADAARTRELCCLNSADLKEGLLAQQEKRAPQFQGH